MPLVIHMGNVKAFSYIDKYCVTCANVTFDKTMKMGPSK